MAQNKKAPYTHIDNTDDKLTMAAILAFIPPTGILGVHNFLIKRYWQGIIRLIFIVVAIVIINTIDINGSYSSSYMRFSFSYIFIPLVAYVWSVAQAIVILVVNSHKIEKENKPKLLSHGTLAIDIVAVLLIIYRLISYVIEFKK
ncbi:NINE protein [Candidatus Saccharibacteria bacterium]|nr:NINE protein [Candidatus Saccharibacteria bacterium]